MDNLYLRMQRFDKARETELLAINGGSVWLTNMTLQGDGRSGSGPGRATRVLSLRKQASVLIGESTILDWTSDGAPGTVALVEDESSLTLHNCRLQDIEVGQPALGTGSVSGSAAIHSRQPRSGRAATAVPSTVAVLNTTLVRTAAPFLSRETPGSAVFYSDGGHEVLDGHGTGDTNRHGTVPALPAADLPPVRSRPLLTAADNPLLSAPLPPVQADNGGDYVGLICPNCISQPLLPQEPLSPSASSPSASSGRNYIAICIGIATAFAAACAIGGAAILLKRRLFKSAVPRPPCRIPEAVGHTREPSGSISTAVRLAGRLPGASEGAGHHTTPNPAYLGPADRATPPSWASLPRAGESAQADGAPPRATPTAAASIGDLEVALDAMYSTQAPLCHQYRLLSSADRLVTDTVVSQLATVQSETVAVKFYTHRASFEAERRLYMFGAPGDTPAMLAVEDNSRREWRAPNGYAFPPFVIVELGHSLDGVAAGTALRSDASAGSRSHRVLAPPGHA